MLITNFLVSKNKSRRGQMIERNAHTFTLAAKKSGSGVLRSEKAQQLKIQRHIQVNVNLSSFVFVCAVFGLSDCWCVVTALL